LVMLLGVHGAARGILGGAWLLEVGPWVAWGPWVGPLGLFGVPLGLAWGGPRSPLGTPLGAFGRPRGNLGDQLLRKGGLTKSLVL
jgi:hypothetical protein